MLKREKAKMQEIEAMRTDLLLYIKFEEKLLALFMSFYSCF